MMTTMKYYVIAEWQGNVGVEYVADSEQEAQTEMARRELLYPDQYFYVEMGTSEPTNVNI